MKKIIILFILSLTLFSCRTEKEKLLEGSWHLDKVEDAKKNKVNMVGEEFIFSSSGNLNIREIQSIGGIFKKGYQQGFDIKWKIENDTLYLGSEEHWKKNVMTLDKENLVYQAVGDTLTYYLQRTKSSK